ncbi:putative phosphoribosyl transferase [Sanguibacter gelidistatuariae]|uniref:Putative phosphoribosyl transferase n=2 Tax=Sanguibacter gelidistatuariae TaxID=1814289 RepID=A0A1G6J4P7_9MICO|nr:phosphoribosyltransferase family protein [Sanguibacter gelidistatuariae]SDC13864.1 putative phosphoribosyl transferase [Sanguibacter gelidistatuariae]
MSGFVDRRDAGRQLARRLEHVRGPGVVVLGLPRGGVPVAVEVARALEAPLDVVVVRKLGFPAQPEVAIGAVGEGSVGVLEHATLAYVSDRELDEVQQSERAAVDALVARLRHGRAPLDLTGKVALVVDDGLATGATARVAVEVARARGAARVVVAVPVAPPEATAAGLAADELVQVLSPRTFRAVGQFYADFTPTSTDEVVELLDAF